ncbi:hypothetical protein [Pseudorhodoferax sp. Leaf267]|uniref:hypothetical protein n=1 Tax=Pseudorhodoferax sp. Leaf267 TaxID=1736316 RepID=UPI0006FD8551|nr:hypothetical protein [Pseudorhodoferax sp. Leaf267]KQP23359.1 hypothetical protein ASF43_05735 [Pseudorhodoferax sp. Leaf267]
MCSSFDVKAANVQFLFATRVGLERNAIETCRVFGLHADAAERLRSMPLDLLLSRVETVGSMSLLVVRHDVMDLLDAPPQFATLLAAAHLASPRVALLA